MRLALIILTLVSVSNCNNETCTMPTKCQQYAKTECQAQGVSNEDIKTILEKHNELRTKIATGNQIFAGMDLPKASNMLEMVWDDEVAEHAQKWANNCSYTEETSEQRNITGLGYTGQNIAFQSNQNIETNWTGVIKDFYSEVQKFNPSAIDKFFFQEKFGHFTQLIWAKTYKIGCGYVRYNDTNLVGNYYHLYGCNYFPGGNIEGAPIYLRGEPCSKCNGTCEEKKGLCAPSSSA